MPKPGLWPPNKPRTTESKAEITFYDAIAHQLPNGWYAWHSLCVHVRGHSDAEADFVIADPARGALILEIKGGRIKERDGLWYSNGMYMALTRALSTVRVIDTREALLREPILSPMIQPIGS